MNWVCDAVFVDRYARVVRSATSYAQFSPGPGARSRFFELPCRTMLGRSRRGEVPLCSRLSLTSWGSDYAAALEMAALRAARVAAVDAHAITRQNCSATHDGRHYTPLLPVMVADLFRAVASSCPDAPK